MILNEPPTRTEKCYLNIKGNLGISPKTLLFACFTAPEVLDFFDFIYIDFRNCMLDLQIVNMSTQKFNINISSRPKTKRPIKLSSDKTMDRTCVTFATADKYK